VQSIDKALRELMERHDLTETEVAARASVTQGTVNKYLHTRRGRQMNARSVVTVEKLAAALGIEPEYFKEYRTWKAVREAIAEGLIELEDIELILAGKRYRENIGLDG